MTRKDMQAVLKQKYTEALGDMDDLKTSLDTAFTTWFQGLIQQALPPAPPPGAEEGGGAEGGGAPPEGAPG